MSREWPLHTALRGIPPIRYAVGRPRETHGTTSGGDPMREPVARTSPGLLRENVEAMKALFADPQAADLALTCRLKTIRGGAHDTHSRG